MVASGEEPLIPPEDGYWARCKRRCRPCTAFANKVDALEGTHSRWHKCCVWILIILFFIQLIRLILQFIMFHYAVVGCSASHLQNYRYPGGGWNCPRGTPAGTESLAICYSGPADNAVPGTALLLERAPTMWGQKYEVYHATEGNAQIDRAPVGAWWRTWGPFFWTYTYEDVEHSQTTLYMRPTLVGMMGLYSSNRIMRCDGVGDPWFFGEGSNWMGNRIRSALGMQRESSFKLFHGSTRNATALETFHGTKSITFKSYPGDNQMGSAVLVENSGHQHDLWSLHLSDTADSAASMPYYVMNAATVLMGYRWRTIRHERGIRSGDAGQSGGQNPNFLMETSDASAGYHEEANDAVEGVDFVVKETTDPIKLDADLDGDQEKAAKPPTDLAAFDGDESVHA